MKNNVRIAFAGASGVGKSTLARHLSKAYDLPECPIGARTIAAEMGYSSPYEVDAAGRRMEFQRRTFEQKSAWEAAHQRFVTDRTVLDNLAYSALHGAATDLGREEFERYALATSRYSLIVYLPVTSFQDLAGDPSRHADAGYHRVYDAIVYGLVSKVANEVGLPFVSIANVSLGERVGVLEGLMRLHFGLSPRP